MKKTTVIIVKFNLDEIERQCLRAVADHTSNYDLIVHDNYPQNENLGKLWNKLISKADTEYVCLLNNDVIVTPMWLEKLLECFDRDESIGIAGPSTNSSHNQQSTEHLAAKFVDFGRTYPGWVLSGFCLVFPKKIWEEIGGFPEDFGFYGQEVALIDKMTKAGYKQCWRTDTFVFHYGSASAKKATEMGIMDEQMERHVAKAKIKELRSED